MESIDKPRAETNLQERIAELERELEASQAVDWWTDEHGDTHVIAANGQEVCRYVRGEHAEAVNKVLAEHEELIAEIASLMQKKQPYSFNPEAPIGNIRTICRYIDELTAERDEWKAKADRQERQLAEVRAAIGIEASE